MIAVDTNVLVYAHREEMAQHAAGRGALVTLAEGDEPWAVPVFVLNEFLRVVTHPRIFSPPTPREIAVAAVDGLLASPTLHVLYPGDRFWPLLRATIEDGHASGNLMIGAAIVALCREHGVDVILSADRDFRRFRSITLRTP